MRVSFLEVVDASTNEELDNLMPTGLALDEGCSRRRAESRDESLALSTARATAHACVATPQWYPGCRLPCGGSRVGPHEWGHELSALSHFDDLAGLGGVSVHSRSASQS